MDLKLGGGLLKALSVSRQQFAELYWTISQRNIEAFLENIPGDRKYFVRFEDIVKDPRRQMEAMSEFMGQEYHEDMIRPYKDKKERMTIVTHAVFFVLGFSVIFIILGVAANTIGRFIRGDILRYIGGTIIILFGLNLLGLLHLSFL